MPKSNQYLMNASIYDNHVTAHKDFPTACEQSPVASTAGKSPCQWHSQEFILGG